MKLGRYLGKYFLGIASECPGEQILREVGTYLGESYRGRRRRRRRLHVLGTLDIDYSSGRTNEKLSNKLFIRYAYYIHVPRYSKKELGKKGELRICYVYGTVYLGT